MSRGRSMSQGRNSYTHNVCFEKRTLLELNTVGCDSGVLFVNSLKFYTSHT